MRPVGALAALFLAALFALGAALFNQPDGGAATAATPGEGTAVTRPAQASSAQANTARQAYGRLPLSFQPNRGQTDSRVRFMARGAGYTLFLTPRESVLSLVEPARPSGSPGSGHARVASLRMRLNGASTHPRIAGEGRLAGSTNYLVGNDPSRWRSDVPGFAGVRYDGVYHGVDLVYHGRQGRLEYDFRVAPRADPGRIALSFKGARRLSLDRRGDLLIHTPAGVLRQHRPLIYQRTESGRHMIAGHFVIGAADRVGFRVGRYDHSLALVIDPVFSYSSYLGGEGDDAAAAVAVDSAGGAYVTGSTASAFFPTTAGAPQPNPTESCEFSGCRDAFVTKLNPDGSAAVYSTYLGGGGGLVEGGGSLAVDSSGQTYVAGSTDSPDFPTTSNAYQRSPASGFLSVLNPQGSTLEYSTYFPDSGGLALDNSGHVYLSGTTSATNFPTTAKAFQQARAGDPADSSSTDAFVSELDLGQAGPAGLVASTYLGGGGTDSGGPIAVDSSGVYLAGSTSSSDFPTQAALQAQSNGNGDGFVTKLDPSLSSLDHSTYLGGTSADRATGIALDSTGVYVAGQTAGAGFPTTEGAYDRSCETCAEQPLAEGEGEGDQGADKSAFVTKVALDGSQLAYSTLIGPTGSTDTDVQIAVDAGNAYVIGTTTTSEFPIKDPVVRRATRRGAFVAEVDGAGSDLVYSAYLSGSGTDLYGTDTGYGIAAVSGSAYAVGATVSEDFPTTSGSLQPSYPLENSFGNFIQSNGFVTKLSPVPPDAPYVARISPFTGPESGGTSVIISGRDFSDASAVQFGTVAAERFEALNDGRLVAVSPPHAEGAVPVTVTTPNGTSPPNPISDFSYGEGLWTSTGAPPQATTPRGVAPPVRLGDGRVLALDRDGAQVYDPKTETWSPTAAPRFGCNRCSLTGLENGKALVVGGGAQLYDPSTGAWTDTAHPLIVPRTATATTLLEDGEVLVAGGEETDTQTPVDTSSAELYDPASDSFRITGSNDAGGSSGDGILLSGLACQGTLRPSYCGKVLIVGDAKLYDPKTRGFNDTAPLPFPAGDSTADRLVAVGLLDGRVLVPGGRGFRGLTPSLLYDPVTETWRATQPPPHVTETNDGFQRGLSSLTLLPNGKALLTSGRPEAELFDPTLRGGDGAWVSPGLKARNFGFDASPNRVGAVLLSSDPGGFGFDAAACANQCGKVLVFYGPSDDRGLPKPPVAQLYTPAPTVGTVSPTGGPSTGDTTVTITGTGFTHDVKAVKFGDVPAKSFHVAAYGQMTAVSPVAAAGPADVTVVNEGGSATLPGAFTFTATTPSAGQAATPDTTAPGVSGFRVTRDPFAVGKRTPKFGVAAAAKNRRHKKGTTFRYTLSEAATVKIVLSRARSGRRKGKRCVAPTRKLRGAKKCTRNSAKGTLTRTSHQGANRVAFSGRIGSKALKPGRYRATLTATDAAHNASKPKTISLKIVKR